MNIFK
jgi:hypothetical protein